MLDLIISGAAHYYLEHETLEDDDASPVGVQYAIDSVVDVHVKDVAHALVLVTELTQRVPLAKWVGDSESQETWLDWLKSALRYAHENTEIGKLVIEKLKAEHGIDYEQHYAERRRIVYERDTAHDAAQTQ